MLAANAGVLPLPIAARITTLMNARRNILKLKALLAIQSRTTGRD
jgi:hypothetical protein